jgi:hypothetical protein
MRPSWATTYCLFALKAAVARSVRAAADAAECIGQRSSSKEASARTGTWDLMFWMLLLLQLMHAATAGYACCLLHAAAAGVAQMVAAQFWYNCSGGTRTSAPEIWPLR